MTSTLKCLTDNSSKVDAVTRNMRVACEMLEQ